MKRQPLEMVDVVKTRYENVLAHLTDTLAQGNVNGKASFYQDEEQTTHIPIANSFENATTTQKIKEIITRNQDKAIHATNEPHRPDAAPLSPIFPTLIQSAPSKTNSIDETLEAATNELRRKEIVTRHQNESIERAESILSACELFQTLDFSDKKKRAIIRFYAVLIELASIYAHQNGQKKATFVSLFTSVELLAACTGYARQTLANPQAGYMEILQDLGVIDFKGHVNDVNGSNRFDGSLLCVKLQASDRKAKLTTLDWKENRKRNFQLVKESGNTVYQLKQQLEEVYGQSLSLSENTYALEVLTTHTLLNETDSINSVSYDCPQSRDELVNAVLDVPNIRYNQRHSVVNQLALNISVMLNDTHSYNFWCSVLWKAHKAFIRTGQNFFKIIANVLMRAEIAVREGKQKGGAYAYELFTEFKLFQSFEDAAI